MTEFERLAMQELVTQLNNQAEELTYIWESMPDGSGHVRKLTDADIELGDIDADVYNTDTMEARPLANRVQDVISGIHSVENILRDHYLKD